MEHRALGKGLSALIPGRAKTSEGPTTVRDGAVVYAKTSEVQDNALQPRQNYDEHKIKELAASIKEKGVLQPILVRERNGGYEVIAGERRLRAARSLGLEEIPVIVRQVDDNEALLLALIENVQREDLNPIEEGLAYKRLAEEFDLQYYQVAEAVGKDPSTISNAIRLLNLPDYIQSSVVDGKVSFGHARALLAIDNTDEQKQVFETVLSKGLSVRALENLIKTGLSTPPRRRKSRASQANHELVFLEEELQQVLGTKVRIQAQRKRGKVIIEFYSPDDLERILQIIKDRAND